MSCQSFQNQIDEAAFTAELNRHLEACAHCKTFSEERECLTGLLKKLEQVNAPSNFEFGVRAKLNSLPTTNGSRVWIRRFAFASPALAAVAVSAFVFTNYDGTASRVDQPTVAVQSEKPAQVTAELPVVSPTPQILVVSNANVSSETPVSTKQTLPVIRQSKQLASGNVSTRQSIPPTIKTNKDRILSRDSDGGITSKQEALQPAPTPLIQPEFRGDVAPDQVLSIFGIEKISADGTIESVSSNSRAAEKGIQAGDKIESVNGQKFTGADLNNSFRLVKIEILRNGTKRVVTMDISQPK